MAGHHPLTVFQGEGRSAQGTSPFTQLPRQTTADDAGDADQAGAQHNQAGRLRNGADDTAGERREARSAIVGVGEVHAEERAVPVLIVALLATNGIRAEGVAVERAIRVVGIVRNHGEPVLRAAAQVYVHAVNFVTIFDEAEAVAAGRRLGHRAGARSYQGAAVAFRDASADFPVTGGGVQDAQVV